MDKLMNQQGRLNDLFNDKFTLIILDACRYDYFSRLYRAYLNGRLKAVKSPASCTAEWLKEIFKRNSEKVGRVKIFSSNPLLNSKGIKLEGFQSTDYDVNGEIIDVWKTAWDYDLRTVRPDTLVKAVEEEGLGDRNIIWFIQPHWPYIGEKKLPNIFPTQGFFPIRDTDLKMVEKVPVGNESQKLDPSLYLSRKIKAYEISRESLAEAYKANVELALSAVKKLLDLVKPMGRVVVTSDHGELLGENGSYLHPANLSLPQLRIVPWLEISC